jgi:Cytochrome c554 and c-prime
MMMTRTSFRPIAAVGLVAAVLTYVGCSRTRQTADIGSKPPEKAASKLEAAEAEKLPKVIAEWSANPPAGILLISGEQNGYLQPCGCTDGQLGGLGRRYDLVEKLRARGWPVVPIDLGNLISNPATSRGGFEQEKIKFDTALKALAAMKYEAVALGAEDLKLGVFQTMGVLLNVKEPKFLAANVKPGDGFEGTIQPSMITKAGPVTMGLTAVIDPAAFDALPDPDKASLVTVRPADEVLGVVFDQLKKQADVRVLMVQGPSEEARRLAEKFPGFDLVVSTSVFPDPDQRPEMLNGGKTLLINVGQKGKYVGVVGLFPGKTPILQYRLQPLDRRGLVEAESMRTLIDDEMQSVLKSVGVVENFPRRPNGAASPGATYVGAETCQACHPKTYEKWAGTKHAKAYEALLIPKRNREHDAECISCHTTGFKYNTGWVSAEKTPILKGNQCENCHGPASLHIAEPDNLTYRKPMALTAEMADRNGLCINCHDEDNDHAFAFASRYAQIFHKGFDSYEDPKVHQPQPAKVANGGR